jgi:Xaa-Pro dipeptidase
MESLFSSSTYINRRNALRQKLNSEIIIFPGNSHSPRNYSANAYTFRQDSSFLYFFGLNSPDLVGVVDLNSGDDYIFAPPHTTDDVIWEGPVEAVSERAKRVGAIKTGTLLDFEQFVKVAQQQNRQIHFLPAYRAETQLWLLKMLGLSHEQLNMSVSIELVKAVVALRSVKDNDEIAEIENTLNTVTSQIHLNAIKMARPGMKEIEIVAMAESIGLRHNSRPAYSVICTINGQYLHNESYHNTLQDGQLLLLDAGMETPKHYATDITRTIPISKQFSQQQKEIYQLTLDMMDSAFSIMKSGVSYANVHQIVSETLAEGLIGLGIMNGSPAEIVQSGAHALFFPHGLGHLLGLDVHDMENLGESNTGYDERHIRSTQFGTRNLRYGKELLDRTIITVEPGIYFIPTLIHLWQKENKFKQYINYQKLDAYLNFGGIRIEDNVLVTKSGNRILGNSIPKTIKEIESLKSSI